MKTKQRKTGGVRLSALLLLCALLLSFGGCAKQQTEAPAPAEGQAGKQSSQADSRQTDVLQLGEGRQVFSFRVTDEAGFETAYEIHSDAKTVGEALLALGLIAGEDGLYGLYVKTVQGITLDYDKDGKYWAFYVDGTYAASGVDSTELTDGGSYAFRAEAG